MHLVTAQSVEFQKEFGVQHSTACGLGVELNQPTADAIP
jgi:hypothetical protein